MKKKSKITLWIVVSVPVLLLLFGAFLITGKKKELPVKKMDFETLMGKDLPAWQYVKTAEDFDNLVFFKRLYEDGINQLQQTEDQRIPKVVHFIWLGPKNFPAESIQNVKTWIACHPDWTFKFWTDRERALPHPKMQQNLTRNFTFLKLAECFNKTDNYAEKADLLRYEILFQEGGVYVDHDVKCLHGFDALNRTYDFYCGLELPSATCLPSSIHSTNNLIAAIPGHPILGSCLDWLEEKWDPLERQYPGKDKEAVIARVAHRTFSAFADSVRNLAGTATMKDMVFPAFYFNAPSDHSALLARHLYAGTWFENETPFEKMTRERLMYLSKKINKIVLLCSVLAVLNVLCLTALFILLLKHQASREKSNV